MVTTLLDALSDGTTGLLTFTEPDHRSGSKALIPPSGLWKLRWVILLILEETLPVLRRCQGPHMMVMIGDILHLLAKNYRRISEAKSDAGMLCNFAKEHIGCSD